MKLPCLLLSAVAPNLARSLSLAQAPASPAQSAFQILDSNRDGGVSADELERTILDTAEAKLTCEFYACPSGFTLKRGASQLLTYSEEGCCDATCAKYDCVAKGYTKRSDPKYIRNPSEANCCEQTCGAWTCPSSGWKVKEGIDHYLKPSNEVCCIKTCEIHNCPYTRGLTLREDAVKVMGSTDEECCLESCALFHCPHGFRPVSDAANRTGGLGGNSEAICCTKG
eukprot:TRINITY_DN93702_c0_g1_i1.p1 TRINITY_DN93702_c0_g1~~TRINITY_DN93702_c0_g1_i1.p1  ORF type:complete len:226 (-),score=28.72 TRINITY_DN93702_c0_g1_i1:25-702(-)